MKPVAIQVSYYIICILIHDSGEIFTRKVVRKHKTGNNHYTCYKDFKDHLTSSVTLLTLNFVLSILDSFNNYKCISSLISLM